MQAIIAFLNLFNPFVPRTYEAAIAPLAGVERNLRRVADEQRKSAETLRARATEINNRASTAAAEAVRADARADKISLALLA